MLNSVDPSTGAARPAVFMICFVGFISTWGIFRGLQEITQILVEQAYSLEGFVVITFRLAEETMILWPIALPLAMLTCIILLRTLLSNSVEMPNKKIRKVCVFWGCIIGAFLGLACFGYFVLNLYPTYSSVILLSSVTLIASIYGIICGFYLATSIIQGRLINAH